MKTNIPLQRTVTIVGVGITGIMVALKLQEQGFNCTVYSKGPDPRLDHDAEQYGATGNGRMGRFITGFEGEPYLSDTIMYPKMKWAFENPVSEGGWLAKDTQKYSIVDQEWLKRRSNATFKQDQVKSLFEDYYVNHNRESIGLWKALYKSNPALFKNTDISDPDHGILRLYDTQASFDSAVLSHEQYGFLKEKLSTAQVSKRFPSYRHAAENNLIAGGIIVDGFAFNVLQFIDNSIDYLESLGVSFFWNTEISEIELNEDGIVTGLKTTREELIVSQHYSINPGAYGNSLLNNTAAKGRLGGVAGRWLIMPRPEGCDFPTKIHGDKREGFPVTDNNLTPFTLDGKNMIAVGGGYVYVGSDEKEFHGQEAYKIVDSENERIMQLYFGDFYKSAKQKNEVIIWKNACVRSFTDNDDPIHEIIRTASDGYLAITAGTNTGTTTIAPYLANWTSNALNKKTS